METYKFITDPAIEALIDRLWITRVGIGYSELICPTENALVLINEAERLGYKVIAANLWCHVTEGHEPCGMGGPRNRHGEGYYSENYGDICTEFSSNVEARRYVTEILPCIKAKKSCTTPAFCIEKA